LKKLKIWFRNLYRLQLKAEKKDDIVWKELKKYFNGTDLNVGIHDKNRYIELSFSNNNKGSLDFVHFVDSGLLRSVAYIVYDYPVELTSDIFILATHFNNIFNLGKVRVNVKRKTVEYVITHDSLVPLIYPEIIDNLINMHYNSTIDVLHGFERLIEEGEAPAIIIADLLKDRQNNEDDKPD
jgi:hypothetical protein